MTTAIMTRPAAPTTEAATTPLTADRRLGELLARLVDEADARIPADRRTRRTLQEMMPGYERQPVLVLHRPVMAAEPDEPDEPCFLCGRWGCDPSTCPPASTAPAPVTAGTTLQCAVCGGRFGTVPTPAGTGTAWVCSACQRLGS
ncbi:hypothetical protein [Streptomyces daghestanicus]|uniref:4Fe-4S ferredoxin-type domain-containing protein n=1 Tax=Streptomyces daghestanicus TaxID=66885 RepID=A0ABQ3Q7J7_9ACTN|nr:hypothetical protein [Streptomyces daghestanicus]GGU66414.1 hypothetical protein GCM10010259_65870 [Streptomyces daghestanicus]GHI33229.1 hypothetical protein Sdagh_49590 [Streptomyces daghestanicus]